MSIERRFKSYFDDKGGYKGGKSGDPSQFKKIHKLSSNENPYGPSPKVSEVINKQLNRLHIYPSPTDLDLRHALLEHYDGKLSLDQFITGNGGSNVIDLLIKGFVNVGDEVIVSSPYFIPYSSFSKWAGAEVIDVPLDNEDYSLDVSGIISALNNKTRIIFLTSPNNPTGSYIKRSEFECLLETVPDDVIVLYDEVYYHYINQDDYPLAWEYVDSYPNLFAINSFSKAYGLAALRVGYGYGSELVCNYLRQIVRPFSIPHINLVAAIAALKDQEWVSSCIEKNHVERAFLWDAMSEFDFKTFPSDANFFCIKPQNNHTQLTSDLAGQGIFVRPLDNFKAPGCLRITVGNRESNEALIEALRSIMK